MIWPNETAYRVPLLGVSHATLHVCTAPVLPSHLQLCLDDPTTETEAERRFALTFFVDDETFAVHELQPQIHRHWGPVHMGVPLLARQKVCGAGVRAQPRGPTE